MIVDIADMAVIYLTYNEPQREEFWVQIQNMVPWAKRVDGVHGSDAAHKAAADASDTDRFIIIDGDNMPHPEFFSEMLILKDNDPRVFRWKAVNAINGLMYGNGGLSCWTKDFVYNMKTHENSLGDDATAIEFCFDPNYIAMNNVYSTTYPNETPEQAWRAGFREGVKMCLRKGVRPSLEEFDQMVHQRNLDNLLIWMNIGADVKNGVWAMYGARLGTYMTMLTDWDYKEVQDFTSLDDTWNPIWKSVQENSLKLPDQDITTPLRNRLGLNIVELDENESMFFKHYYSKTHKQMDCMTTEMDVIQKEEGWK